VLQVGEIDEIFVEVRMFQYVAKHSVLDRLTVTRQRVGELEVVWIQERDIIDQGILTKDPTIAQNSDRERFIVLNFGNMRSRPA
jgi:hypothetical protein